LGRKTKNKFEEAIYAIEEEIKFRLYNVELPFSVLVTCKSTNPNVIPFSFQEIIHLPVSEKDRIVKEVKKQGYEAIKIEPYCVKYIDTCPQCNRKGIPKFERKDTMDRRHRTGKYGQISNPSKRPNEYWLTYDHKTKPKKCRVSQLIHAPQPMMKKNLRKKIEIKKSMFPYALEYLKN